MLVFGYKPLFLLPAPVFMKPESGEDLYWYMKVWQDFESPKCEGLAWCDKNTVIIVIDQPKEIYEHILKWTEGKPSDWFHFAVKEFELGYVFALHPNVMKSVERTKLAAKLYGQELDDSDKDTILYEPLSSACFTKDTINGVGGLPKTGETMVVMFANKQQIIDGEDINEDQKIEVLIDNETHNEFLNNMIKSNNIDMN